MIRYECDKCGMPLQPNDLNRFIVRMEVYAAAGPVELDPESLADTRTELTRILHSLKRSNPDEVEDQTYRSFRFDLCDACRRKLLEKPLG